MKKWYRIGICLVLAVCLLLLSACQGNPSTNDPTDAGTQGSENTVNQTVEKNTGESTSSTGQTEAKVNDESAAQTAEKGNDNSKEEPEEPAVSLTYKASFVRGAKSELTGAKDVGFGEFLNYESYKAFFDRGITNSSLSYSKEFFEDHSLLLICVPMSSGSAIMEVSEVKYKDGAVYCYMEYPVTEGLVKNWDVAYWYCLIEVDEVLPAGTRVMFYGEDVNYSMDTYYEKQTQFRDQCA